MDRIGDMLNMIKLGGNAKHPSVTVPHSKQKLAILECLLKAGYIAGVSVRTEKGFPVIDIAIRYENDAPRIHEVARISKPSRRMYSSAKDLRPFHGGHGSQILSTPKGILTDKEAKKQQVGGEILLSIW
jgi:small subunit ribosomal protein S8